MGQLSLPMHGELPETTLHPHPEDVFYWTAPSSWKKQDRRLATSQPMTSHDAWPFKFPPMDSVYSSPSELPLFSIKEGSSLLLSCR